MQDFVLSMIDAIPIWLWSSHPLWAFQFAHPWMLTGLLAAGIPILIHLLRRQPQRETEWAAMRFLLAAMRRESARIRLLDWLLLFIRVSVIVLVVLALAEPTFETEGLSASKNVPTHHIVVLDTSFSMGYRPGATATSDAETLLERAKRIAHDRIVAASPGDRFSLVTLAGRSVRGYAYGPTPRRADVLAEIDQLPLSHEVGDVRAALDRVMRRLDQTEVAPRSEIVIVSDFQKLSWSPGSEDNSRMLRAALQDLAARARLLLVDVGEFETRNVAVCDFRCETGPVTTAEPVRLQVRLKNFGPADCRQLRLDLLIDKTLVDKQLVDVPGSGETEAVFEHLFDMEGDHALEVRLEPDALPSDNSRWLVLPVKTAIRVLLVDGRPVGPPADAATYYVRQALAPASPGHSWHGRIRPEVIRDEQLGAVDLADYSCVFLCDVATVPDFERRLLEQFVASGGGLVIALGDRVDFRSYNDRLFHSGNGLLPSRLVEFVGDTTEGRDSFTFHVDNDSSAKSELSRTSWNHPILRTFRGMPQAGLETAVTFKYVQAVEGESTDTQVVLRFNSGDPAVVEKPFGAGRSILITTSLDSRWGTWPAWATSFVPMMHELASYVGSGQSDNRQLTVGQSLSCRLPAGFRDQPVTARYPDGSAVRLRPVEDRNRTLLCKLTDRNTDRSGIYEVQFGEPPNPPELRAVNVDSREGNLSKLSREEVASLVTPGTDFVYEPDSWPGTSRRSDPAREIGSESGSLLFLVFLLVVVEVLFSRLRSAFQY